MSRLKRVCEANYRSYRHRDMSGSSLCSLALKREEMIDPVESSFGCGRIFFCLLNRTLVDATTKFSPFVRSTEKLYTWSVGYETHGSVSRYFRRDRVPFVEAAFNYRQILPKDTFSCREVISFQIPLERRRAFPYLNGDRNSDFPRKDRFEIIKININCERTC